MNAESSVAWNLISAIDPRHCIIIKNNNNTTPFIERNTPTISTNIYIFLLLWLWACLVITDSLRYQGIRWFFVGLKAHTIEELDSGRSNVKLFVTSTMSFSVLWNSLCCFRWGWFDVMLTQSLNNLLVHMSASTVCYCAFAPPSEVSINILDWEFETRLKATRKVNKKLSGKGVARPITCAVQLMCLCFFLSFLWKLKRNHIITPNPSVLSLARDKKPINTALLVNTRFLIWQIDKWLIF